MGKRAPGNTRLDGQSIQVKDIVFGAYEHGVIVTQLKWA